ncbi:hypothetical protein AB1Y20_016209 [Prymnesium parvum]|uniref:EF-hand domain-containing protein n=1 Tax=Prymnesium parvum TaxID=97485 RepID=A0AB34IBY9_PRYPA
MKRFSSRVAPCVPDVLSRPTTAPSSRPSSRPASRPSSPGPTRTEQLRPSSRADRISARSSQREEPSPPSERRPWNSCTSQKPSRASSRREEAALSSLRDEPASPAGRHGRQPSAASSTVASLREESSSSTAAAAAAAAAAAPSAASAASSTVASLREEAGSNGSTPCGRLPRDSSLSTRDDDSTGSRTPTLRNTVSFGPSEPPSPSSHRAASPPAEAAPPPLRVLKTQSTCLMINKAAERKFVDYDLNGDGKLDREELEGMFMSMLVEGGHVASADEKLGNDVRQFLNEEIKLAMSYDTDWDDAIGFEEFVNWYNMFLDKRRMHEPLSLRQQVSLDEGHAAKADYVTDYKMGFSKVRSSGTDASARLSNVDDRLEDTREIVQAEIDFRVKQLAAYDTSIEHGAKWGKWRDEMRENAFGNGNEVFQFVMERVQAGYLAFENSKHGSKRGDEEVTAELCGVAVLMLREVGAGAGQLWTKTATNTAALEEDEAHAGFKLGELWSPKSDDPLTRAAYKALRANGIVKAETRAGSFFLHALSQLDGHVYGVMLTGPQPAPEACFTLLASAAGPVYERAHRFDEMRAGVGDCLLFYHSRAANATGVSLASRFEWAQYYSSANRMQVADPKLVSAAQRQSPGKKKQPQASKLSDAANPEYEECMSTHAQYARAIRSFHAEQQIGADDMEWRAFTWLGDERDTFEQVLRWPKGVRHTGEREIGTMFVNQSQRKQFPARFVQMLYSVGTLLERFVEKVAHVRMEVPNRARRELRSDLQSLDSSTYRFECSRLLQRDLRQSFLGYHGAHSTNSRMMSLLGSYSVQPDHVVKLVKGALLVLNHDVEDWSSWDDCRGAFGDKLFDEMLEADFSSAHAQHQSKNFRKAIAATKGMDYAAVLRASLAVRNLLNWFEAVKYIHLISIAITDELYAIKQAKEAEEAAKRKQAEGGEGEEGLMDAAMAIQRRMRGQMTRKRSKKLLEEKKTSLGSNVKAKVDTGLRQVRSSRRRSLKTDCRPSSAPSERAE